MSFPPPRPQPPFRPVNIKRKVEYVVQTHSKPLPREIRRETGEHQMNTCTRPVMSRLLRSLRCLEMSGERDIERGAPMRQGEGSESRNRGVEISGDTRRRRVDTGWVTPTGTRGCCKRGEK